MPLYKAPVEDVLFLLNDVFHIERFANLPVDEIHTLKEGSGTPVEADSKKPQ